jgi:hypothetical protein
MPRYRPTSVLVLAILHLVGGGLGLLGGICGGAFLLIRANQTASVAPPPPGPGALPNQADIEARQEAFLDRTIPAYQLQKWGGMAFDLLLSVLLITAGLGLLWMQPWARYLSLVYAVLSILFHIYYTVYQVGFYIPALNTFLDQELARFGAAGGGAFITGMKAGMYFGALVSAMVIAYPIVVLCLLLRPSMNVAFSAEGLPPEGGEYRRGDREDYYDPPRGDRDRWGDDEEDERFRR